MKKSKIVRFFISAVIAFAAGCLLALTTNEFITRPSESTYCPSSVSMDCANPITGSSGWPFPSSDVYANGQKQFISADFCVTYCKGGQGWWLSDQQILYNALILSIPMFIIVTLALNYKLRNGVDA